MKTTIQTGLPVFSRSSVRLLLPVFVAFLSPVVFAAGPQPAPAEPKTHTLFMGADLSVEQNKETYRVQDVVGSSFVINVKGKEVRVPMDRGPVSLKIDPSLKLTESSATVTNLKAERSYTLANDPTANFVRGLNQSEALYADAKVAQNQATAGFTGVTDTKAAQAAVASDPFAPADAGAPTLAQTIANQNAQLNAQKIASGPGSNLLRNGSVQIEEGMFDAMDLAFEVSSEKPLDDPYVVIVVQYRALDARPGQAGNWIYARALKPISHEPLKVHVEQGGFPRGFELQGFQVHLYNQGEEIATNVAPKRMALTREEAFQYVVIDYVSHNKGASRPATPAMGKLPGDLRTRLTADQLSKPYFVKVSKDGMPIGTYVDKACSQEASDAYVQSVVKEIRFKPALENGKAVDGVARLQFSELRM